MSDVKDRIAAIDAIGREIAELVNAAIEREGLVGQSPATIRRVEELIDAEQSRRGLSGEADARLIDPRSFEFHVIGKGITAKPFVSPYRYTGKVAL
jgi:hypothetical protein